MKKIIVVCAVLLFAAVNAFADTIVFKSGKTIDGTIKTITNNTITVNLYGVTDMTYDLRDIDQINGQKVDLNLDKSESTGRSAAKIEPQKPLSLVPPEEAFEQSPQVNEKPKDLVASEAAANPVHPGKDAKKVAVLMMTFIGIIFVAGLFAVGYLVVLKGTRKQVEDEQIPQPPKPPEPIIKAPQPTQQPTIKPPDPTEPTIKLPTIQPPLIPPEPQPPQPQKPEPPEPPIKPSNPILPPTEPPTTPTEPPLPPKEPPTPPESPSTDAAP